MPPSTRQENLAESEDRFRSLAENAAEPIITIDGEDRIVFANQAAERVFGYPIDELLQLPFTRLIPERFRAAHRAGLQRYMASGERRIAWNGVELPGLRADGSEVMLEVSFGHHMTRGTHFFTGIMRDITERRLAEEEHARVLERERVARTLAEEASRAKSDFLATMSHEIRTPLNAVIGYTSLLADEISGPLNDAQADQLERIKISSRHLLSLIDDILDLAKVEARRMTVGQDRCLVIAAVAGALALVRRQAHEREITITDSCTPAELAYVGDEDRVRQVLVNLLSNALKFTAPGGSVAVHCGAAQRTPANAAVIGEGPWVYIAVEDTGSGIEPEDLARIFRPFEQAESGLTRTKGGTGLGLSISRELARLMEGDLVAESKPGVGSKFTLWLPHKSAVPEPPDQLVLEDTRRDGHRPHGMALLGQALHEDLRVILDEYAIRIQSDRLIPAAANLGRADVEDHASSFLTDIFQALVVLETSEVAPVDLLRDGTEIQRVISHLHGAQRARVGWTERGLRREWAILREVIATAVERVRSRNFDIDYDGGLNVLHCLLDFAEQISRRGMRRALVPAADDKHP